MRAGPSCRPVCYEMFGRPQPPGEQSRERERDRGIHVAKDLSRTVDYLQTRSDMDLDEPAYLGCSWGGQFGPTFLVAEPRFKAAIYGYSLLASLAVAKCPP